MELYIDVIGACNLSCPSCPVGNSPHIKNTKGVMSADTLRAILQKAINECTVECVYLFNWADPLIHPQLPELIQTIKSFGIPSMISSNLNLLQNEDTLMAAEPSVFRISISGYTQENYGIHHRGGHINKVLENLNRLVEAKIRTDSKTIISLYYHRYLGNLDDEFKLRELATTLGINFETGWAYLMPIEKMLALAYNDTSFSPITEEDYQVLSRLALPFNEALSSALNYRDMKCHLLENQIIMDVHGDVILCCGIYNQSKYKVGNFLEKPLSDITKNKHELKHCQTLCETCTQKGIHVYATNSSPEFDLLATRNIFQHYAQVFNIKLG